MLAEVTVLVVLCRLVTHRSILGWWQQHPEVHTRHLLLVPHPFVMGKRKGTFRNCGRAERAHPVAKMEGKMLGMCMDKVRLGHVVRRLASPLNPFRLKVGVNVAVGVDP